MIHTILQSDNEILCCIVLRNKVFFYLRMRCLTHREHLIGYHRTICKFCILYQNNNLSHENKRKNDTSYHASSGFAFNYV